jgi:hypothetical protein
LQLQQSPGLTWVVKGRLFSPRCGQFLSWITSFFHGHNLLRSKKQVYQRSVDDPFTYVANRRYAEYKYSYYKTDAGDHEVSKVLLRLWAAVTASCLFFVVDPFTGAGIGTALSLMVVIGLGLALRWAIFELSRELL